MGTTNEQRSHGQSRAGERSTVVGESAPGDQSVTPPPDSRLPQGQVFELLNSRRRRLVLYHLKQHGDGTTVTELSKQVAAVENETDVESLAKQQQKRVYISLYQTHVPKLADAGIIEHDEETGEIRLTGLVREVDPYLAPEARERYPWHLHYLVLAVLSSFLFLLHVAGLPLLDALPAAIPGGLVIAAFAISAIVHYVHRRPYRKRAPYELSEIRS